MARVTVETASTRLQTASSWYCGAPGESIANGSQITIDSGTTRTP
jgi:hypothetical protein